jgi:hypothetical protein
VSIKLPDQKIISVSLPESLLKEIDARAASVGLSRSAYLSLLARQDIANPATQLLAGTGDRAEQETSPSAAQTTAQPSMPVDLTAEVYQFLLLAIPALEEYARQKANEPSTGEVPEPSEEMADSVLWRFFLHERDEILRLKWLESENAQQDIGLSAAIQIWLQRHRTLWAATHRPAP